MALGEAAAVLRDDERDVDVARPREAERGLERNLAVRRVDEVVAAQHLRDAHRGVVDRARELVSGAVGVACEGEVAELAGEVELAAAEEGVIEGGDARRSTEAPDGQAPRRKRGARLLPRGEAAAAAPVVGERMRVAPVRRGRSMITRSQRYACPATGRPIAFPSRSGRSCLR